MSGQMKNLCPQSSTAAHLRANLASTIDLQLREHLPVCQAYQQHLHTRRLFVVLQVPELNWNSKSRLCHVFP
jgi:hypothetical protein